MLESIILGIIQGITEWLPISSEGMIVLARTSLFRNSADIVEGVHVALFLHIGTFFAALVYFRKDIMLLVKALATFPQADEVLRQTLVFLIVATFVS